jgi:hypothetical protein
MTTRSFRASRADAPGRQPVTSAQRVILVLGVPLVVAGIAWTGYGIVAAAGHGAYTVTSSAPLTGRQLTVNEGDVGDGADLTIQGGAATGSLRVSGTVGYDLTRPDISPSLDATRGPAGTSVDFACPQVYCQLEAAASVPSGTAVSVTTNGGGDASISGVGGPVSASTNGGNLTLNADTGTLALSTDGGNLEGTALAAPDATVNTGPANFGGDVGGGGSVDLMLTTVPKELQINSGGGDVTVQLPAGSSYRLQLDGGCGKGSGPESASPSSGGSGGSGGSASPWCPDVSSSVPDDPTSANVIVVSSGGGQITIT